MFSAFSVGGWGAWPTRTFHQKTPDTHSHLSLTFRAVQGHVQAEGRWGGAPQGGFATAVSCHCKLPIVVVAVEYMILAALGGPPSGRGSKQLPGLPVHKPRP